jgi:hypothetical protein
LYIEIVRDLNLLRSGNAVKNRWNWMAAPKRGDVYDCVVRENAHLFRQILQWKVWNGHRVM